MKNKILKFSKGDFQAVKPKVEFEETNLVLIIGEGEVYKGNFTLKSESSRNIRGLLYTSSFRINFKTPGFEGNPAVVDFTYDGKGLTPGHVEKGTITVVSDAGEFTLNFTAIIEKPYVITTYGKVQSTEDFRKLAIKDYNEAARLFRSRKFYDILKYENDKVFYLYDNMRKWELDDQAMEEFMVGIKQKECIFLTLSDEGKVYENLTESEKGIINLMKNTWGYMPVDVETTSTFIHLSKTKLTTEDFIGNSLEYEYYIQTDELHAGRNFGAIKFVTPYETLTYNIEVNQAIEYDENKKNTGVIKAQLMQDYIAFEAGLMDIYSWLESAGEKLQMLCKYESNSDYYQLLQAHIYLMGNKIDEAKWIIDNFKYNRFSGIKNPINNAYYLFVSALLSDKDQQKEKALEEIYKALSQTPDTWVLLTMAMTLDRRLRSPYRRIDLLEEYYEYGTREVLFYLEVFKCYKEKGSLLRKLGKLELEVLNFATKYKLMSKEIALYVANLASQQKTYNQTLYRILVRLYEDYNDRSILYAICNLLIKGNKVGLKYFLWYKKAVEADLKIAQLYEFYMYSIDGNTVAERLPRKILLYFMHSNNLDYKKQAVLYSNVVKFEDKAGTLYLGYRDQMIKFTWDMLMKRRITEPLRVLYKTFCKEDELTPERIEAMRDICYSYNIKTRVNNMKVVLVIEKNGEVKQQVRYDNEEGAIIRLYDKESRIVWESKDGHHYTDSIVFETTRLFSEPIFLDLCAKYQNTLNDSEEDEEKKNPTLEGIKQNGIRYYRAGDLFAFCGKLLNEGNLEEDELILQIAYYAMEMGYYDAVTLEYLSKYYCGPTVNMKRIWNKLGEFEISGKKIAERIITQAVFSEHILNDEKIFADYYLSDLVYFRLKQAYLAYVSREYVLYNKELDAAIFEILAYECKKKEELADVCKIALLKYYSENEYPADEVDVLHRVMRELCEKRLIFPFYLNYNEEWLRELQLFDKTMILYKAKPGSHVKLFYKINCNDGVSRGYQSEIMMPVFENLYLKQFILFNDESVNYYTQEISKRGNINSEKKILKNGRSKETEGKFGRINKIMSLDETTKSDELLQFAEENMMSDMIFKTY